MNTQRNRWRVICLRYAVPGIWLVGELKPGAAGWPDSWWSDAMFHNYDAAIVYATWRAAGYSRDAALFKALHVDARVAWDRAQRRMDEALVVATECSRRAHQIVSGEVVDGGAY